MVALESAVWFTKGSKAGATFNWQLGQQKNVVEAPIVHPSRRIHPTQKALRPLEVWIAYLSSPGDLVADFVCGSGSTLVAADRLGRSWFGCDICEEYVIAAREWVRKDRLLRAQLEFPQLDKLSGLSYNLKREVGHGFREE